ncbi:MAG: hypothetical protein AAGH76_01975 [Pseudomonadota bacterium]
MDEPIDESLSLRERVERHLPRWQSWYPSVFDAARDLGLIRAEVCPPSQLLLSNRHSRVRHDAQAAHREQWGVGNEDVSTRSPEPRSSRRRRKKKGREQR